MTKIDQIRKRLSLPSLGEISTDSEAYAIDGAVYCRDCTIDPINDDTIFILADEEVDIPMNCDSCGILLPSDLTEDGQNYVLNTDGRTRAGKIYREAFPWLF